MALWDTIPYSLRQLQYLVAVAELGGFRKAAAACGVSQPSLSAQVAQLEDAIGVQVFERGPRGVRVTAAGALIVDRARQIFLAVRDLDDTARQQGDPFTGTLRLGVIPTVCPYLLPEVADPLRARLPNLRLIWSEEKTAPLVDQIDGGRLDGAIVALDDRMAHLEHAPLGNDPFVLAAAPGHALMKHHGPASAELLDGATVFLLDDGHCFRAQALAFCGAKGAHAADLNATGLSTLVQMVGGGTGVTLLPRLALAVENRRGQLAVRQFKSPAPMRKIVMVWRKGTAMKQPLDAIASAIRKAWPKSGDRVRG